MQSMPHHHQTTSGGNLLTYFKHMPKLPQYVYVQIDDIDGNDVYYTCHTDIKNLPFAPGPNHPVAKYKLEKLITTTH